MKPIITPMIAITGSPTPSPTPRESAEMEDDFFSSFGDVADEVDEEDEFVDVVDVGRLEGMI